ncbi:GNAT family N-acetyltransferase [Rhodomicrobium vannielii ATCC 17100]|uniref:GNAT family N-acetyltransferase n=1 Tax=Rhodomicrobium vannielii TaxID=1069 RepID=UPI001919A779|nr:GNAT family N-acetyltransferase [Rhodomicrobium vannielii]MBJ7535052.1 GNAT family N-acetyltransferase [Rhodomicrobium vannielii ATCC 17100]
MQQNFETPRLILRPLTLEDAPAIQRLFPHWEIVRFMSSSIPWPYPEDGAHAFLRDVQLPAMERRGSFCWTIRLKNGPDHLIGTVSLFQRKSENRAFWLALPWQSQGIMMEACEPVTDFWFNTLMEPVLIVTKAVDNIGSRRITEKQGGRVIAGGERAFLCGRRTFEKWELTREDWNARPRG